jgi:hypothetical protein
MTQKEDREKLKVSRETMGKFFYDLAKAMVIGAIISLFSPGQDKKYVIFMLVAGVIITFILASVGNFILKR